MSYSLLLDSSNSALAIGLASQGKLVDEIQYDCPQRQSELMVEEIDHLLTKNKLTRLDLDSVIVTKGPGSYTGVRIALSIAKTIVFALEIPLYLVSSLEVQKIPGKASICVSNARGKRSYVGVYQDDETILEDCLMDNEELLSYIEHHPDYVIAGDASYLGKDGEKIDILENLATSKIEKNLVEPLGAKPVYLKDSSSNSTLKIVVREMNSYDVSSVMDIEKECFSNPYTLEQLEYAYHGNPFGHIYVAMVGPDVVGFIDFLKTFDSATINQIAVKAEFRKHGVGNRLMGELVKFIRSGEEKAEFLTLEVRQSNENAIRFYKKHSFENITTKKAYYEDGEDAIYMVRSLVND